MEIKERNAIIGVILFIVGLILIIYLIPMYLFSFFTPFEIFLSPYGYLCLDIFVLLILLLLFGYFMIKPINTLRGQKNLAISAMVLGGILIVLPLIGMVLTFFILIRYSFRYMIVLIPFLLVLIPGITLYIHGWFLKHKLRTDKIEQF
ncbi:MAG: hypothetical protein ACFE8L_09830 [Candidatus Hodarchaeota archaeon]